MNLLFNLIYIIYYPALFLWIIVMGLLKFSQIHQTLLHIQRLVHWRKFLRKIKPLNSTISLINSFFSYLIIFIFVIKIYDRKSSWKDVTWCPMTMWGMRNWKGGGGSGHGLLVHAKNCIFFWVGIEKMYQVGGGHLNSIFNPLFSPCWIIFFRPFEHCDDFQRRCIGCHSGMGFDRGIFS